MSFKLKRQHVLFTLFILMPFETLANNGLRALGNGYALLFGMRVWFIASIIALGYFTIQRFDKAKLGASKFVYISVLSLALLLGYKFHLLISNESGLISGPKNKYARSDQLAAISAYQFLIFIAIILLLFFLLFLVFDRIKNRN
ncbi:MAG: hypothetical protein GQ574_19085 [Crocinitomix sp.]|nr:hypothetical protein [Crocinitomix sp.]